MPYNHSIKAASPSGTAYTGRADGLFSLNEQVRFKSSGLWAIAIAAPSAPIIGTATYSSGQASITFTAPSSLNGSTITGYTVTSSGGQTATGASSPILITLSVGSYTFTVTANSNAGSSAASAPSNILIVALQVGQVYAGGFYAGGISIRGDGTADYNLIVAPKATGESTKTWGTYGVTTGITSVINGPTNSASLAALGADYQAAIFAEGLTIGGYSDWYLPARNELEVLYYNLKPTIAANEPTSGSNANAVSPEPISSYHVANSPAQTSVVGFRTGETDAFAADRYWSSTEYISYYPWGVRFNDGADFGYGKQNSVYVRAVRRISTAPAWPVTNIGDAYGGGYFAGQLKVSGVYYNLIVAPASTGQSMSTFGPAGTTGATSSINGSANTATISALGASYTAARFCKDLTIGGYTDWYLPSINEQELLYFYFKGNLYSNDTDSGANVNAVPPEPINTKYTASYPARTTIAAFLNTEWFISGGFWTSTEYDATNGIYCQMATGKFSAAGKVADTMYYRAVRKVLAT